MRSLLVGGISAGDICQAIREVRIRVPLRKRLRHTPAGQLEQLQELQSLINAGQFEPAFDMHRASQPNGLWESTLTQLDDAYSVALPSGQRARLWCDILTTLRDKFHVHPIELNDAIAQLGLSSPSPTTRS